MRQNLFIQFSWSCYFQGGGSLLLGGRYFQGVATFSGIYKRPQKIGINFREDATYRESLLPELLWYGQFRMLNIPKCEHFTLLVCPLWFLVISAMRQLGYVQSFKCFAFELFAMNATPARRVTPPWDIYMANCHPGWQGYLTWQTGQPT